MSGEEDNGPLKIFGEWFPVKANLATLHKIFEMDVDVFFPQITIFGYFLFKFGFYLLLVIFLIDSSIGVVNTHIDWSLLIASPGEFLLKGIDWSFLSTLMIVVVVGSAINYWFISKFVEDIKLLKNYEANDEIPSIDIQQPYVTLFFGGWLWVMSLIYRIQLVPGINANVFYRNIQLRSLFAVVSVDFIYIGLFLFGLGMVAQSAVTIRRSNN